MDLNSNPPFEPRPDLQAEPVKRDIIWQNVLFFIYLHISFIYGAFLIFTQAQFVTIVYTFTLILISTLSVTLGCHRLWTHKCYNATFSTRLFFIIGHTLTCQGPVYDWVLDHRVHHKYHGTELDVYNYKKGFQYSQLTCRLLSDHPLMQQARRDISMDDIEEDSLVTWQKVLYWWVLMPLVGIYLPIHIPLEYFGETFLVSLFVCGFFRLAVSLHCAWLINSSVTVWGLDLLDKKSMDTNLIFLVNKSLWPQYHYLVPWDYQFAEYGNYGDGFCNAALRVLAALGFTYDLRTINTEGVREALYESVKFGKPLSHCLQKHQFTPSFEQMISYQNKGRL